MTAAALLVAAEAMGGGVVNAIGARWAVTMTCARLAGTKK